MDNPFLVADVSERLRRRLKHAADAGHVAETLVRAAVLRLVEKGEASDDDVAAAAAELAESSPRVFALDGAAPVPGDSGARKAELKRLGIL